MINFWWASGTNRFLLDPVSAIGAGAGLVGSAMSSSAAKDAANTQADAANTASANQMAQYNQTRQDLAPWRAAGTNSLSSISGFMGLPTQTRTLNQDAYNQALQQYNQALQAYNAGVGSGQQQGAFAPNGLTGGDGSPIPINAIGRTGSVGDAPIAPDINNFYVTSSTPGDPNAPGMHAFNASDLNANLAPNYQFMLDQGLGSVRNSANASGGLVSGNALKGINDYAQNYAKNAYQDAYNNYNTNQTNIFNRLSSIAGLGQTATNNTGTFGANAANNASNFATSGAAAQAAGTVGSANALTGGINNAVGWNYLSNLTGGSSGNSADPAAASKWGGSYAGFNNPDNYG